MIGVIRGEELADKIKENPTLKLAEQNGMQFHFVSRETYRNKTSPEFIESLKEKFGAFYLLPEGGTKTTFGHVFRSATWPCEAGRSN